jgi:hypothetical protein
VLRSQVFTQPPTHILSRLALQEELPPTIVAYPYHPLYGSMGLAHRGNINYAPREHYFLQHGITIGAGRELPDLEALVQQNIIISPSLWLVYPVAPKWGALVAEARDLLAKLHYDECGLESLGAHTMILRVMWDLLDCEALLAPPTHQTDVVDYQFGAWSLDEVDQALYFSDKWSARDSEIPLEDIRMSYQLISEDWQNVAQVDLPLAHPDRWRRFSIDINEAPRGRYRLMMILYDSASGERYAWLNSDNLAKMLALADIELS